MTPTYRILPLAQDDLFSIWLYLAEHASLEAALAFERRFYHAFEHLARHPNSGHRREDLTARPLRFWSVRPYLIAYRAKGQHTEIIRVLHGKRDIRSALT